MALNIELVDDITQLRDCVSTIPGNLFQSEKWLTFQSNLPDRAVGPLLLIKDSAALIGYATIIIHHLPAGQKYAYLNRAPIMLDNDTLDGPLFLQIHDTLSHWCKKNNILFYRVALPLHIPHTDTQIPQTEPFHTLTATFKSLKAIPAPNQHQPVFTSIIDISLPDEEILATMKPKGRYNIKVAQKHGISVTKSIDVAAFYDLVKTTTTRNKFSGNTQAYYEKFLQYLDTDATLYLAYHEKTPVAGIITAYEQNTAIYYYGASDIQYRKWMAPYLIHWEAIHDAKARGCTNYDLFGIAPPDTKNHPWAGITQFKEKFGGITHQYMETFDFPASKAKYTLFSALHKAKKAFS